MACGWQQQASTRSIINEYKTYFASLGIDFTMPYVNSSEACHNKSDEIKDPSYVAEENESDNETDKWLDDMGISQNISVSANVKM